MRSDLDTFMRGILFAVCSIQQSIIRVPLQLRDIDKGNLTPLFGHKREAYDYLLDHGSTVWRTCTEETDFPYRPSCSIQVIGALCKVPGLGIVKSAFIAQMLGHDVACLDTIHIRREKRNPRAYRSDGPAKKTGPAFERKIQRYVAETFGKAEHYWNSWCIDRADFYDMTPEDMSAIHLEIVR
jgi:hypothetical protein